MWVLGPEPGSSPARVCWYFWPVQESEGAVPTTVTAEYFLGIRPQQEYRKYSKGWRNTFKEMDREYRHHLSRVSIQTPEAGDISTK